MTRQLGFALYFLLFSLPTYAHAIAPLVLGALITGAVALTVGTIGVISAANSADDAIDAQEKENAESRQLEAKLTREQLAEAKRQFGLELGLAEETLGFKKEGLKATKQQRAIENTQVIGTKFMNSMNRNHQTAKSFYDMAERKRNKAAATKPTGPIGAA